MPFVGELDGSVVLPWEVKDDVTVDCLECDGKMGVRPEYYNQGQRIRRHFAHKSEADGCGGESPEHQLGKAFAARKLGSIFAHATVELEKQIVPGRIADVLVRFDEPQLPYGHGIACEIQHKHKGKETGVVQHEYLNAGFSIIWGYMQHVDFDNEEFTIDEEYTHKVWPKAVPEQDEWSGYPRFLPRNLHQDSRTVEATVPARFPTLILAIHQFDIKRPLKAATDPRWQEHESRTIHGRGNNRAWLTLYGHPDIGSFLELRTKVLSEDSEDWLAVPVSVHDRDAIAAFADAVAQ